MQKKTTDILRSGAMQKKLNIYCRRGGDRFWELDFLRGLCVLLMVFDHFMFNIWGVMPVVNDILGTSVLADAYEFAAAYWDSPLRNTVRFLVLCTFFGLCGVSCTLSKNNFKRAMPLVAIALAINVASAMADRFFESGLVVVFGVFHMLAVSVLVFALLYFLVDVTVKKCKLSAAWESVLKCIPSILGIFFIVLYFSLWGRLDTSNGWVVESVVSSSDNKWLTGIFIETIKSPYLYHADYFPLLPWGTFVLAGSLVGRAIYHTPAKYALKKLDGPWNSGICLIGRHAALVYIGHMAVIPALLVFFTLVSMIF